MYNGSLFLSLVQRQEEAQRRLSRLERFSGLLVTMFTLVVGVLIVFTCLMADYQARLNESNALLGWMIYYFVFWLLPMQDYKLGLAKQEGKHLLSWIFLCGFHLLFLDAYCTRLICKALGSHSKFPPHLLLAVAALPLPVLVLAIPIKVYLDMMRRPPLVVDRLPGEVRTRSFGNPAGAPGGATSKRDPLPPPSYSEVEGLDLPDYRDLEFADESFKVGYENEEAVVRHTAEEYNEDKDIERGKNFPQSGESGGGGGVGLGRLSGCADERGEREDIVDEGRVRGSFLSDGDGGDGGGLGGVEVDKDGGREGREGEEEEKRDLEIGGIEKEKEDSESLESWDKMEENKDAQREDNHVRQVVVGLGQREHSEPATLWDTVLVQHGDVQGTQV